MLIVTKGIALFGFAEKISATRMICLFAGIVLILFSLQAKWGLVGVTKKQLSVNDLSHFFLYIV
nr:hypothetical protein [Sporosarcina sp. YIM B06819]